MKLCQSQTESWKQVLTGWHHFTRVLPYRRRGHCSLLPFLRLPLLGGPGQGTDQWEGTHFWL